uniref:Uncharacterized protein n=1 Tax=Arundo donax TaxID=35708 RepID=A0A0A9QNX2_ARUDO
MMLHCHQFIIPTSWISTYELSTFLDARTQPNTLTHRNS